MHERLGRKPNANSVRKRRSSANLSAKVKLRSVVALPRHSYQSSTVSSAGHLPENEVEILRVRCQEFVAVVSK